MKHLFKVSLLLLALCLPLAAAAYDFEVGGVYYMTDLWDDFAMVCDQGEDGAHYSGNVTIPAIEFPAGPTEIGTAAFEGCGIARIDIPAEVTTIKMWAFQNCPNLSDVYCHITDPSQIEIGFNVFALDSENYAGRTLHVPAGALTAYKDSQWSDFFGNIVEM